LMETSKLAWKINQLLGLIQLEWNTNKSFGIKKLRDWSAWPTCDVIAEWQREKGQMIGVC
jgi:hypothetical protein